jgi:hypothetical protein
MTSGIGFRNWRYRCLSCSKRRVGPVFELENVIQPLVRLNAHVFNTTVLNLRSVRRTGCLD